MERRTSSPPNAEHGPPGERPGEPKSAPAEAEPAPARGWSTSSYGHWSVSPSMPPKETESAAGSPAIDRAAIVRLLQGIGTELLFGGDPDAAVAKLQSWGASAAEARRIVNTAVSDPLIVNGREMALMLRKRDWLLASLERLQQLSPRAKTIERRANLSGGEFLELYYARNRPVVLEAEMEGWPARSKWTLPFLGEAAGLLPRGGGIVAKGDETAVEVPMSADVFALVAGDLGRLEKFLDGSAPPRGGALRIAQAGAFVPLRCDARNRFLAQIAGRTKIKLAPAAEAARIYDRHGLSSEVDDLDAPELDAAFPMLAGIRIHDIELEPGEILFVPMAWWHQSRALTFGIAASFLNFRWPNDMDRTFPDKLAPPRTP